jgi:TonB family protein
MQTPGNIPPQYPDASRKKGEMGQVQLLYFVTAEGTVASLQLAKSSGYVELDQEAIRSIRKYRYQPGQQGYTSHTVNFILRGDAKASGGTLRTSSNSQLDSTKNN